MGYTEVNDVTWVGGGGHEMNQRQANGPYNRTSGVWLSMFIVTGYRLLSLIRACAVVKRQIPCDHVDHCTGVNRLDFIEFHP
jgi:hypothetical protein